MLLKIRYRAYPTDQIEYEECSWENLCMEIRLLFEAGAVEVAIVNPRNKSSTVMDRFPCC